MKRKASGDSAAFILDQLCNVRGVTSRAMFGGLAFYYGGRIFGMEYRGRAYLRVAPEQRERYESCGMKPFEPMPGRAMKSYYEAPLDVIEDGAEFTRWARDAIAAAAAPPAKKRAEVNDRARRRPRRAPVTAMKKAVRSPGAGRGR